MRGEERGSEEKRSRREERKGEETRHGELHYHLTLRTIKPMCCRWLNNNLNDK